MRNKKAAILAVCLIVIGFLIGCSKKSGNEQGSNPPPENCDGINAKFTADILPLIQTSCAIGSGCHGTGSRNGPGELTNFNQIKNAGTSIQNAVVSGRMPIGGSLSNTQIRQISCWVHNGTLNN